MSAIVISCSLLAALFAILLVYRMRRKALTAKTAGFGSLRMCPFCGLITSRSETCCLECG